MNVNIALIDDDHDQSRQLKKIVENIRPVKFDDELISITPHEIVLGKNTDGNLDFNSIVASIQRINAGLAIVDLRLYGDDPQDFSGVELSLMIKAACKDCCIILISSFLNQVDQSQLIRDLDIFRYQVGRAGSSYAVELKKKIKGSVKTYMSTVRYRKRRFSTLVNGGKDHMWALALEPEKAGVHLHNSVPLPNLHSDSVMVRIIEIGVCGTDHCAQGTAPTQPHELVDFHEAFGEVVWVGEAVRNLKIGDRVVPMVRRCENCLTPELGATINASSWDFQLCEEASHRDCTHQPDRCPESRFSGEKGKKRIGYSSRGTGRRHGFGSQYFVDTENWLIKVKELENKQFEQEICRRYILTEPLSIVWKVRREILKHHKLRDFKDRLLIVGIGPIGLLAALVMHKLHPSLDITAIDLADDAKRRVKLLKKYIPKIKYYQATEHNRAPVYLGVHTFDIIIEATTEPQNVLKYAPSLLKTDGILALLGIRDNVDNANLNAMDVSDLVRRGNIVIGSINSSRADFEESIGFLQWVSGEESKILERMVDRWVIDSDLNKKLIKVGQTAPWERDEIKVVLTPP